MNNFSKIDENYAKNTENVKKDAAELRQIFTKFKPR